MKEYIAVGLMSTPLPLLEQSRTLDALSLKENVGNAPGSADVFEGIAIDKEEAGLKAGGNSAESVAGAEQLSGISGSRFQNIAGGNACFLP